MRVIYEFVVNKVEDAAAIALLEVIQGPLTGVKAPPPRAWVWLRGAVEGLHPLPTLPTLPLEALKARLPTWVAGALTPPSPDAPHLFPDFWSAALRGLHEQTLMTPPLTYREHTMAACRALHWGLATLLEAWANPNPNWDPLSPNPHQALWAGLVTYMFFEELWHPTPANMAEEDFNPFTICPTPGRAKRILRVVAAVLSSTFLPTSLRELLYALAVGALLCSFAALLLLVYPCACYYIYMTHLAHHAPLLWPWAARVAAWVGSLLPPPEVPAAEHRIQVMRPGAPQGRLRRPPPTPLAAPE